MASIIDQALQAENAREVSPPPKKKQKVEETIPIQVEWEEDTEQQVVARKHLISLYLKNPDLDTTEVDEIHSRVNQLNGDQVIEEVNRVKCQLNRTLPGVSAHSFLELLGQAMDFFFGTQGLAKDFIDDDELSVLVEHITPDIDSSYSLPIRIVSRLVHHVSQKTGFNKK